jgi:RHS repeat-associated protein
VALPEASGPVTYDAADQQGGSTYDDDGNVTDDGTATYTWNARGELASRTSGTGTFNYAYDGLGRRAARTAGGVATGYVYDGLNPVQEKVGGRVSATMMSGELDEVFSRTTSGGSQSLLRDALGSTVAGAGPSTVDSQYTYGPFGMTTADGDDLGNTSRFTGREDEGDGLYYYRARYYSPAQGRFLSRDPLGLASGDTNPYAYVLNQPTGLTDPMGTKPTKPPTGGDDDECAPDPGDGGEDWVDPEDINFSQRTISANDYAAIMRAGQWDWNRSPLTVIDRGGQLVSYDNRRLDAARQVRSEDPNYRVKVARVDPNSPNPAKSTGKSWDQSFEQRMRSKRNQDANGCRVPWKGLYERPEIE